MGSSPATLVLGVSIATRHGGPPAFVAIVLAALVSGILLYGQGLLGLRPPIGGGASFAGVARSYLGSRSLTVLNALLLAAMVGWFGFNVALGGTALSALLGVAAPVGATVVGAGVTGVALGGIRRWNALALVTTLCTMALVGLVQWRLAAHELPVTGGFGASGALLRDVAAFVGFVAVFALRAPDFSAELRSRASLVACVLCFVVPMTVGALVGVGVHLGTGTEDVVALLAGAGSLASGNLLIAVGVVAPTLAALHSGRLAGQGLLRIGPRAATAVVVAPGALLALGRFDLYMQPWLAVLAAALPALIVPMAVEGTRRRRGAPGRRVPLWTWVPGSVVALALLPLLPGVASAAGLTLAGAATGVWLLRPSARTAPA